MSRFERSVTRMANATPLLAPRCAPTRSAATVTGWTFGNGCMRTRRAVMERTMVASMATVIRFVRGGAIRKAKAVPTSTMSRKAEPSGDNSGPCTPKAWNMNTPRRGPSLRLATVKPDASATRQCPQSRPYQPRPSRVRR